MQVASIIIPTHDRAATLAASVRSALAQTVADIEVVIAGDGCTEAVRAVAHGLAHGDARVLFLDRPKAPFRGAANRDAAVRAAAGELIFYNDDDDLLLPHHVATLAPALADADIVDTPVVSVRPDGTVDLGLHDSGDARQRALLAEGRVKTVFDTHLAHRKAAYLACGDVWAGSAVDDKPVTGFLQTFARAEGLRWVSLPRVTALSFHGARRATMGDAARAAELDRWAARIGAAGIEAELRAAGTYNFHVSNLTWALSRAGWSAAAQEAFVDALLGAASGARADEERTLAAANIALSMRGRGDIAASGAIFADLLAARYGPIPSVRNTVAKFRPAFTFPEIAAMPAGADPLVRLLIAVRTGGDWQAADAAARAAFATLGDEDAFGFAAEAMAIVGERHPEAARYWADAAEAIAPVTYAEPYRGERAKLGL